MTLDELRWDRRIIIAAGTDADAHDRFSAELAAHHAALVERDLAVYRLEGRELVPLVENAPSVDTLEARVYRELLGLHDPAAAVGHAFEAGEPYDPVEFLLILVGRDGSVKRRATAPAALVSLIELIDTMPMRQREMGKDGA